MSKKIIRIGVADFFDVRPITDDEASAVADKTILTKLADGRVAVRELKGRAGVTRIELEQEVEDRLVADAQAVGKDKSRVQLIAEHLENAVMPHHSGNKNFTSVSVEGDGELEQYLAARFGIETLKPNDQYVAAMHANNADLPAYEINAAGKEIQPVAEQTLVTVETEAARHVAEAKAKESDGK